MTENEPFSSSADEVKAQRDALRELLKWVREQPAPPSNETTLARDHDLILNG